jgi:hypothetical protein
MNSTQRYWKVYYLCSNGMYLRSERLGTKALQDFISISSRPESNESREQWVRFPSQFVNSGVGSIVDRWHATEVEATAGFNSHPLFPGLTTLNASVPTGVGREVLFQAFIKMLRRWKNRLMRPFVLIARVSTDTLYSSSGGYRYVPMQFKGDPSNGLTWFYQLHWINTGRWTRKPLFVFFYRSYAFLF